MCLSIDAGARLRADEGQTTVEAAFAIPVVFILLLLLIQPAIVLYDRIVMESAAAESCRMLATAGAAETGATAEEYVRRRLSAIPQAPWFHIHDGGCSYQITLTGGESSDAVGIKITNELTPLPLIGGAAMLLGATNGAGHLEITVECTAKTQPSWVGAAGVVPADAIGQWMKDE